MTRGQCVPQVQIPSPGTNLLHRKRSRSDCAACQKHAASSEKSRSIFLFENLKQFIFHCLSVSFRVLQVSLLLCGDSCRNPIQSRYSRGYLSVSISKLRVKPYLSVSIRIYFVKPYLSVSKRIYSYLFVSIRIYPYLNVSKRI